MELLNRISDSGSRAPSQDHPAQEPEASENEAEMNALGRTQPFQTSEREGGFTAGSPNLTTREERREANSQDAADFAEEEIRRLDAQLDAARLRFANLKQNLGVKSQEESKKIPLEISTEAPASAGALSLSLARCSYVHTGCWRRRERFVRLRGGVCIRFADGGRH